LNEQRKALERSEVLIRQNKDLEKKIEFLTYQAKQMKAEKKNNQEEYSQKFIILRQRLEELREQKKQQNLALESQLKMEQKVTENELKKASAQGKQFISKYEQVAKAVQDNPLLSKEVKGVPKTQQEYAKIREIGKQQEIDQKATVLDQKQKEHEKQLEAFIKAQEFRLKEREKNLQKVVGSYEHFKTKKELELQQSREELFSIYQVAM